MFGEDQFKGIQVYDIIQDKENNYYISTSEGTYFYDFYHFEKLDDSHLKKSSLFSFKRSKDGNIYCFNINYQICKIKDKKITVFYELLQDEIRSDVSLSLDENDNLFIGAKKIIVLNKSGAVITRHSIHHNYIGKGFNRKDGKIQYSINHTDSIIVYNQGKFEIKKISLPLGNKTSLLEFFQIADSTFAIDLQSKKTYFFNEGTFELSKEISNNLFERIESTRPYEVDGNLWLTGTLPGVSLLKSGLEALGFQNILVDQPLRLQDQLALNVQQKNKIWQLWSPNKALGLTGIRGAYAIAPLDAEALIQTLRQNAFSWPLGAHAVTMLQAWTRPQVQAWLAQSLLILGEWKERQMDLCRELNWTVLPSVANFYCATPAWSDGVETTALLSRLRLDGIKLRDATSFGLAGSFRLRVMSPEAQDALYFALRRM